MATALTGTHGHHRRLLSALTYTQQERRLALDRRPGDGTPETWFLGPKGENGDFLKSLVARAIDHAIDSRKQYMPHDPPIYPESRRPGLRFSEEFITKRLDDVLLYLRGSVPLSSHRNLSHMYWDQSLPAITGYIAGLLYNQNNVAAEASPTTTLFEIEVGNDLCRMLGYSLPSNDQITGGAVKPWGHITCGGSVANAESIWAARNLKYLALALAQAIRQEAPLAAAKNITVRTLNGQRHRLLELGPWQLLNLPIDEVIALAPRISKVGGISPADVEAALALHSVQSLGLVTFHRRYLPDTSPPLLITPATAHYSFPKGMALVGLGREQLHPVPVDLDGRMDTVALRAILDRCLDDQVPVMQVTAVMGTTEESAVDPLADIIALREEYRAQGLEFSVHADCAWGGYFASLLRETEVTPNAITAPAAEAAAAASASASAAAAGDRHKPLAATPTDASALESDPWSVLLAGPDPKSPGMMMSEYVLRQFLALPQADTITVDPHKAGFIPYPAGALCYRNGAMRDVVAFTAPVVYHGGIDPTVGVYGIEGSKPGAAAAAVYMSHLVIRPDRSGYGDLLSRCIFNSKRFYASLVGLSGPCFTVTPFQRLPVEKTAGCTPADVAEQRAYIANHIAPLTSADLAGAMLDDPNLFALFRDIGPDLTITTYAFNLVTANGPNRDLALMNEMNDRIYRKLSLQSFNGGTIPTAPMFVTSSQFTPSGYGQGFVDTFATRAGVTPAAGLPISFLISTVQNPWLGEADGGHLTTLMNALFDTATEAAQFVMARHGLTPPDA
ncbi:pyridoxal phosphate-dependent decarboxylase family protein [Paragemmobacter straminiformis]|uniref:Decarboxylase n=1 Tax=Paragemmobacter straminiformis TaxID=2045119 RepID=A0A842ICU7_9RHOB|nr:pyridoxal-dependent decarboxylase [Gemmobacter straminiformis]MBC2836914.1 decarboxylase [Gemmobacter straminiformis]